MTFPTIGAAVPATGIYDAINVAGTLRGLSGLATGSIFPLAAAIVDASGNQITAFGATGSTSNASSGVATSSTNVPTVSYTYGFNGTTWDQLQVDASKNLKVTSAGLAQGATAAGTSMGAVGGQAVNAEETALSNGQISRVVTDLIGRLINFPYANKENLTQGTQVVSGTSSTLLVPAAGSSLYNYITMWHCTNSGGTTTRVTLQNGSGGSIIDQADAAASGGGFVITYPTPFGGPNTASANTAIYFAATASTTSLTCSLGGFKGT